MFIYIANLGGSKYANIWNKEFYNGNLMQPIYLIKLWHKTFKKVFVSNYVQIHLLFSVATQKA